MSKLSQLASEMSAIREKMRKEGEQALKDAFKEFFENHPVVEKILWTQYTPYFMDGDPCVFGVNEFELRFYKDKLGEVLITEDYEDEDDERPSYGEYYDNDTFGVEHKAAESALVQLASQCYDIDTILQDVFGDHCLVVATAKGFDVSEYEHD